MNHVASRRLLWTLLLVVTVAVLVAATAGTAGAAPAAPAPAQQTGSCTLASVSAGPVDVNAAGLVGVHVDPVAADVTLNGLLGTLLCGVLSGGAVPGA
jgi:hypothetical protein